MSKRKKTKTHKQTDNITVDFAAQRRADAIKAN